MISDDTQIMNLTIVSFFLIFFYATQDIAVDGWALEIFSYENKVSHF